MKIGDDGGTNGVVFAAEMQEFIHKLSTQLAKDERLAERDAREVEIQQGLQAANDMHEKAKAIRTGAIIGGLCTIGGAGVQFVGVAKIGSDVQSVRDQGSAFVKAGESTAQIGGNASQLFNAQGADAEGDSQSAQVRSKAGGSRADEAVNNLHAIEKIEDSAKELFKEIADNQHAGIMAILSRQ